MSKGGDADLSRSGAAPGRGNNKQTSLLYHIVVIVLLLMLCLVVENFSRLAWHRHNARWGSILVDWSWPTLDRDCKARAPPFFSWFGFGGCIIAPDCVTKRGIALVSITLRLPKNINVTLRAQVGFGGGVHDRALRFTSPVPAPSPGPTESPASPTATGWPGLASRTVSQIPHLLNIPYLGVRVAVLAGRPQRPVGRPSIPSCHRA